MRIGLVCYEYPPQSGFGGVGTYVYRLAGALGKAGHEVIVLAGPTDVPYELPQPNVTLHRVEAYYDPPAIPGLRYLWWKIGAKFLERYHRVVWHWWKWNLASQKALAKIHRETPLDVIEAPEHAANGLFAGKLNLCPMVVRLHGPWDLFFGINRTHGAALNRMLTNAERESCRYAKILTAPSRTMAAFMHERWRLPTLPRAVANFMDVPDAPAPLPDGPIQKIICAGRLERFKGQDCLVKAFARIAGKHPSAQLVLIGPDQWSTKHTFQDLVNRTVADESIRSRIILTGPLPLAQVQAALKEASIAVICSSGFESFSFSTLEAMAHGRPIIGSRVGAIPELLDGGACGRLAAPGNAADFAQNLDELLSDKTLCQKLATAAHEKARRCYHTDAVLPEFVKVFEDAIRKGPRQPFRVG